MTGPGAETAPGAKAAPPAEAGPAAPRRGWRGRLRTRPDWLLLTGVALTALFLAPARHAAFRGDDTWVSELRGEVELMGTSLLAHIRDSANIFLDSGRPAVVGTFQGETTAYLLGGNRIVYHLFLIALALVAAALLYTLVRQLGFSRRASFVVLILLAGSIQLRSYHDPMLGYWGSIQLVLILTLASLIALSRALRDGNRRLFWISVLLFLPAPLLYEGSYTLVAAHLGIALMELRGRAALRAAVPFLAIGGGFVLLSLYLRATAPGVAEGYQVGSSPIAALRTYFIQLVAPLPASNLTFRADYGGFLPLGGDPTAAELFAAAWRALVVFAVVVLAALKLAGRDGSGLPSGRALRAAAVTGALLWTTPVIAVATSPKYQTELVAGKGHLPTLIQVFGWSLVIAAAVFALLRSAARRSTWALRLTALGCGALLALATGVTAFNNMRVVALEVPVNEARGLLERSASEGAFDSVPDGGTLIFSGRDVIWPTGNFSQLSYSLEAMLLSNTGRRLDGRMVPPVESFDCPRTEKSPAEECEPPRPGAAWVHVRPRVDGGSVVTASLGPSPRGGPTAATTQSLRLFETSDGGEPRPPQITGLTTRGGRWTSRGLAWQRVERGDGWAIFETRLPPTARVVASSLNAPAAADFGALGPPEQVVRRYGTKRLLP